ncbi:MAG: carboxypeptidase regulatory-like domain-containing protein, partial [Chitinophagaceae bacterium]
VYEYSNNNTLTNNIGTGYAAPGIMLYLSSDNILTDNTGTSNAGAGLGVDSLFNTTITGGSYSSASGDAYFIKDAYNNNTLNNTNFTTRKIYFEDIASVFEYDNGAGVWLKTQIVSPLAEVRTNRTLLKWTDYNLSWSETWSADKQVQYNVSGLLPNRDYLVYNGTALDYQYTSDASGVLAPFTINFTTVAKTVTVSLTNLNVSGHVYNELGLALQDARIDMDSNYAFSDASGYYNFSSLPAGEYDILARKIGYENNTNTTLLYSDTVLNFTMSEFRPPDYTDLITGIMGMVMVLLAVVIVSRKRKERKENRTDINKKKGDNNSW